MYRQTGFSAKQPKENSSFLAVYGSSVAQDPADQLRFMKEEEIFLLEAGFYGRTPIVELRPEQADAFAGACLEAGVEIIAVRTPIGLSRGPQESDHEKLVRCVRNAQRLGARYVLLQTYWRTTGEGSHNRFPLITSHFQRLLLAAMVEDITFCIRNVAGTTCETSLDLVRFVDAVSSFHLRAVYDPANAALVGETAYSDGFPLLVPYLAYIHARDFDPSSGIFVPPGEGVCQWPQIIAHLKQDGFNCPVVMDFSMSPTGDGPEKGSLTRAAVGALSLKGLLKPYLEKA